ncbi:glutamate racemase [Pantoea agglomerans]|uniref:glutamate racemase n=1 Tax=Enterobacter agglomerans TaxID=549 RepID=UPI00289D7A3D|nr:glutamate racemase [Pantoea agglomerans]WNK41724.1 glutamate racemase [Pantoea agglomerans]
MPALLAEAERSGGMTTALRRRIAQMIETLLPQFDAVLITCSTLGPVAGDFSAQDRVMRTDGMLAEALQRQAGRTVALVEGAWTAFKAGETTRYFALIAAAAEQAYQQGAVAVALAQSSMTPAAQQFPVTQRPLTGPYLALQACYELR